MTDNTQILYTTIPTEYPTVTGTFKVHKSTIDLEASIPENTLLIRTLYASVDPYMRFRMRDPSIKSYFHALEPNKPLDGGVIGEIIKSNAEGFAAGDVITSFGPWANYGIVPAKASQVIPNARKSKVPLSYYLGATGMPGLTAYVGLHKICEPIKSGETLFVSAASGAVGQVVGQYAKELGLRVVGSAGTDEKVQYLIDELKFDAAFNHRKEADYNAALKRTCPNGIDIYFENVGGPLLEAVLENANSHCRIPICGMISQYNKKTQDPIRNLTLAIGKSIRLQGFIVSDSTAEYGEKAKLIFGKMIQEGKLKYKEHITDGIETLPQTFVDMLHGNNFGKAVVKIASL